MMRTFFQCGIFVIVLMTCTPDEPRPLIKGYAIDWESDPGSRYAEYLPIPGKSSVFRFLHINTDGSIVIIHTPENSPLQWTATKLSSTGEFIMDVTLSDEYVVEISMDDQGNLETLSSDNTFRIFRTWNSDLTVLQKQSIPFPARYTQIRLHKSSYYLVDYYYDTENMPKFTIARYTLDGTLKWSRLLSEYDAKLSAAPRFFGDRDELLFIRFSQDSVQYSKVNGLTGGLMWGRRFPLTDFGRQQYYVFTAPLNSGKLLVVGEPYPGVREDNWAIINQIGLIHFRTHVDYPQEELSRMRGILEEEDGGFLVTLDTDGQTSPASFKLLKLDSHFNVGWIGTFNQLVQGYVAQIKKSNRHVIVLTSNGYLYGLKRQE